MKVHAQIRVDRKPPADIGSGFLLRFPVPSTDAELVMDWLVDGRAVQRDVIDRRGNGNTRTTMASVMVAHDGPCELTMQPKGRNVEPSIQLPADLADVELHMSVRGSERFKARPFQGEQTYRYTKELGPFVRTEAHFCRFRRDSDGKELMGLWAFATIRADGVELVTFHISNACAAPGPGGVTGFNGPVYFHGIFLATPTGKEWISDHDRPSIDPQAGWLVAPLESGKPHSIFPREHFHRRVALVQPGDPAGVELAHAVLRRFAGVGVAEGEMSFKERPWGPSQVPLPKMEHSYRYGSQRGTSAALTKMADQLWQLEDMLRKGTSGPQEMGTEPLGWAHPIGSNIAYNTGGRWIYPFPTPMQVSEETALVSRFMMLDAEREPLCALHHETGYPLGQFDFAGSSGQARMEFAIVDTSAAAWISIPGFDRNPGDPWNSGDCPYRQALSNYFAHDAQHGVRNTLNAKGLLYATNDPMAEFHLRIWAEHHILARTSLNHRPFGWGSELLTNFQRLPWVKANPKKGGVTGGREHGWIADATATYYAVASNEWRNRYWDWFVAEAMIWWLGTTEKGIGMWSKPGGHVHSNGKRSFESSLSDDDGIHQTFEIGIAAHGVACLLFSVFDGVALQGDASGIPEGLAAVIVNSARFIHESQLSSGEIPPSQTNAPGREMPAWYLRVHNVKDDTPVDRVTHWGGGGEGLHGHWHLLYAYLLTDGDPWFLERAFNLVGGPGPRRDGDSKGLAIREGAWYVDRVLIDASGWNWLLLHHAAGLVALMQYEWNDGQLRGPQEAIPGARAPR